MTLEPSSTQRADGRVNGHSPHRQPSSSRRRCEPHSGQHQESSCQRCPAATQVTLGAPDAAQTISGSSALAITWQRGAAASASRQRRATIQISAARSIWSRLRLSSVTTRAPVAFSTAGMNFSSVSSTANGARRARLSADTRPASMFAPNALVATSWPSAPSAAVISRVVVVFPLVPVTSTTCRSADSSCSRFGSSRRLSTPPMTDPSPRPVSREARPATLPTKMASRARSGSFPMAAEPIGPLTGSIARCNRPVPPGACRQARAPADAFAAMCHRGR